MIIAQAADCTTHDSIARYERIISKANEYHKHALWQEKLRLLQEALAICDEPGFPQSQLRRQELLFELGGIRRRSGQYDQAEKDLQLALQVFPDTEPLTRARILGELGVILRHRGKLEEARDVFREQYRVADRATSPLEADAEKCRAIGNEGRVAYNMWRFRQPRVDSLLEIAFAQSRERIQRARDIQRRVRTGEYSEDYSTKYLPMARTWESIGLNILSLCHLAASQIPEAIRTAEECQELQDNLDPCAMAFSRFFYGNALWAGGRHEDARKQWSAPRGTCNSVIAVCRESSSEYTEYIERMADADIDFDSYDEQGFTALDYAVLNDESDGRDVLAVISRALRIALRTNIRRELPNLSVERTEEKLDDELSLRRHQAELRRQYRILLQDHIRPALRITHEEPILELRSIYTKFLTQRTQEKRIFSPFCYVRYHDYVNHGKLPVHGAGTTQGIAGYTDNQKQRDDDFVIFFSYRWLGENAPDDEANTQWRRMKDAVDGFLEVNNHIASEKLGIWLDYACIDQDDEERRQQGIDSLPVAITLCNAMISLVDAHYYERAWCVVEMMLMRALLQSHAYGVHQWWEHELTSPETDRSRGLLKKGNADRSFELAELKLTKEEIDRPKVDFLLRQSKLLGRDEIF